MKTAKKVFLLLNGLAPSSFPNVDTYDLICATDGAVQILETFGVTADVVIGDFDSASHYPQESDVLITPNQDFTDFEKALELLFESGYRTVDVFGASGKEQDHFLGNLHVALVWKDKLDITFLDDFGSYQFIPKNFTATNIISKTVSLYPFPIAKHVKTNGLKFPLENEHLELGLRIGIRNKAIANTVEIAFTAGNLIVFIEH